MKRRRADIDHRSHPATCPRCRRDFVVATALVDFIDDGLFRIALQCTNCGDRREADLEDAQLEQLEEAYMHHQASMIDDIALLAADVAGEAA